ncbi:hypothetical protein ACUKBL_12165 [Furfurilactobacillus rossiae]|uniref:hypothetical protein n=1 Tax=Furfurilactobacillus rossiae TaxID=231049 RepID=UPI0015BF5FFF|nr:hypothetical protein [Furfurilactobacillus rossiae]MCF6166888.1 hypothetical protein [Furfurilactobacillus rossiae]
MQTKIFKSIASSLILAGSFSLMLSGSAIANADDSVVINTNNGTPGNNTTQSFTYKPGQSENCNATVPAKNIDLNKSYVTTSYMDSAGNRVLSSKTALSTLGVSNFASYLQQFGQTHIAGASSAVTEFWLVSHTPSTSVTIDYYKGDQPQPFHSEQVSGNYLDVIKIPTIKAPVGYQLDDGQATSYKISHQDNSQNIVKIVYNKPSQQSVNIDSSISDSSDSVTSNTSSTTSDNSSKSNVITSTNSTSSSTGTSEISSSVNGSQSSSTSNISSDNQEVSLVIGNSSKVYSSNSVVASSSSDEGNSSKNLSSNTSKSEADVSSTSSASTSKDSSTNVDSPKLASSISQTQSQVFKQVASGNKESKSSVQKALASSLKTSNQNGNNESGNVSSKILNGIFSSESLIAGGLLAGFLVYRKFR